jgi:Fe-Mn family superoxide dismutase
VAEFTATFIERASTVFGSGWTFLALNADRTVSVNQYSNSAGPIKDGGFPLLCVDNWEHAWHIDYESRKAEFLAKFFDSVSWSWSFVESQAKSAGLI